jgi:hypothetical protein
MCDKIRDSNNRYRAMINKYYFEVKTSVVSNTSVCNKSCDFRVIKYVILITGIMQ